ncbi:cytochrome c oxidase assembly protein [Pseudoalteromonas denitrificans]|jgi:cytochrome c oxidase assembly protein subunit 11|uniref:Cytochrome c oxidase assembly protein CtaG n=1 Tax=Pseudoalteromonas denitrificans DSM 6059 TaxID=1123010 RepID=A0A1I1RPC6_9GAMM|nr:cytochrome c oxidase assembly protein [Pseudoalteromonas denitrificans]SFD36196.1 cytochrome c oxidase assembly protein subunit 11 [Pseudoalteromonas denitrificans DSM 6059]
MNKNGQLIKRLIIACIAMFGFAFALVPLYDVFCDVTGLNGKPNLEQAKISDTIDTSRAVDVGFITHIQGKAPFEVEANKTVITVQPGAMNKIVFKAKNISHENRVMQAVPSVSPGIAAKYMHKIECFCFNQQPLTAGESADLALLFYIDTALPKEIEELTLSYTVFDITKSGQMGSAQGASK